MALGVLDQLGLEMRDPNIGQRGIQAVAASRIGSWVFSRTMHHLDRPLFELTGGRVTMPGLMAGLPVIMLTTTGARTGEQRTSPLVGVPHADDLAVVGSNFAQPATPGWVYNLEKTPDATVAVRDRSVRVQARRADDNESDAIFSRAAAIYPGFTAYRTRVTNRSIRVYVLEAAVG